MASSINSKKARLVVKKGWVMPVKPLKNFCYYNLAHKLRPVFYLKPAAIVINCLKLEVIKGDGFFVGTFQVNVFLLSCHDNMFSE